MTEGCSVRVARSALDALVETTQLPAHLKFLLHTQRGSVSDAAPVNNRILCDVFGRHFETLHVDFILQQFYELKPSQRASGLFKELAYAGGVKMAEGRWLEFCSTQQVTESRKYQEDLCCHMFNWKPAAFKAGPTLLWGSDGAGPVLASL